MRAEFQRLLAQLEQLTGKRYPTFHAILDELSDQQLTRELLHDLQRFKNDVEYEITTAKKQGNKDAWQRGKVY